ncbi:MAG: hypothetical protein A2X81_15105 [Desulfobacterales bacterium GWB2_56_26]|nr:MAG: hypothetical protein A2X81_15105 [Desulfobacterales bacterium GWB2_56_26]
MRHLLNRNLQLLFVIFCTKLLLTGSVQGAGSLAGEKAAPNPQRHQVQQASPLQGKVAQLIAEVLPQDKKELRLYLAPLHNAACKCTTEFSRSFLLMTQKEIERTHTNIHFSHGLPSALQKPDQIRSIKRKVQADDNLEIADARLAGADMLLTGDYLVEGTTVTVTLVLKNQSGEVLRRGSVTLDSKLITAQLTNPLADRLSDLADRREERNGNQIKITTTKGSTAPLYRENEKIVFLVQLKKPLFLYIYSISTTKQAELLFPYENTQKQKPMLPGDLLVFPDDSAGFEFLVQPPFGTDIIKVFASPVALEIPEISDTVPQVSYVQGTRAVSKKRVEAQHALAARATIHSHDLVDYYRGMATKLTIELFEDSLLIETTKTN